jgi:hypothetical protein
VLRRKQFPIALVALLFLAGPARGAERPTALERGFGVQARVEPVALSRRDIGDPEGVRARRFDFVRLRVDAGPLFAIGLRVIDLQPTDDMDPGALGLSQKAALRLESWREPTGH